MRIILALSFLFALGFRVNAQYHFIKQWDYRYGGLDGDGLVCFQITSDGGFILGGWSSSAIGGDKTQPALGTGIDDFWFVKLDSTGHKQWDKRYGTIWGDYPRATQQTKDEGYIIAGDAGASLGDDKTEPSKGGSDYWIIKIDRNGVKEWDKTLGGNKNDYVYSVIQTKEGGYLVGGTSESGISGDKTQPCWDPTTVFSPYPDYWIVKTDSLGHKLWDKRYGGTEIESLYEMKQTSDAGYILTGHSMSDSSGDKSQNNWSQSQDGWLVKIDSIGNKQWDRRFGGGGQDGLSTTYQTNDGGYIVAGQNGSPSSGDNSTNKYGYWLIKLDSLGNKQWDNVYDGAADLFAMSLTLDGGYLLSGENRYFIMGVDKSENNLGEYQTWMVKTDSLGNKQWDKTIFTNYSHGGFASQTNDGCFVVVNTTAGGVGGYKTQPSWGINGDSTADYWIIKFCMEPFNGINTPKSLEGDLIKVWPNPFATDLSIALTGEHPTGAGFTITNTIGQAIYHQTETNLATG